MSWRGMLSAARECLLLAADLDDVDRSEGLLLAAEHLQAKAAEVLVDDPAVFVSGNYDVTAFDEYLARTIEIEARLRVQRSDVEALRRYRSLHPEHTP